MAIGFEKKLATGSIPVFGSNAETAPGGFLLNTTGLTENAVLVRGTPLVLDEAARTATPLHTGVVQANAGGSATEYRVKKGHTLQVGDYLSKTTGGAAYAITDIDTSNADYDELTVGTTIGAATAGDLVFASTATGGSASALPALNGLLYEETLVKSGASVSAVIHGTVYARRIPYNAAIAALTGLKHIIFIQSK